MHGRTLAVLLALAGMGSTNLNASMGYLASIGPAALRFREPVKIARPPQSEPPTVVLPDTNVVAVATMEPSTEPMIVRVPPEPVISQTLSNSIGEFVSGQGPDSQYAPPSVLLRFFTGAAGLGVGSALVPVGFNVPLGQPAPMRSSATYEKSP